MLAALPLALRSRIVRYLLVHWRPQAIVNEIHYGFSTIYEIQQNMLVYESSFRSQIRSKGGPRKVHRVDE